MDQNKKFNTNLFSKPFSSSSNLNSELKIRPPNSVMSDSQIINQEISQSSSLNQSASSFQNEENQNKKRKPFDILKFQGKDQNINSQNDFLEFSQSNVKSNLDTQVSAKRASESPLSTTKSIKSNVVLSNDIVEKALKFNKVADKEETPFYIKFCLTGNEVVLNENSSYFKAENKDAFLQAMKEMTINDAILEEKTAKLKELRKNNESNLKNLNNLLLTEIKIDEKVIKNPEETKDSIQKQIQEKQTKSLIEKKIESVANETVEKYQAQIKSEKEFEKNVNINYQQFRKKQLNDEKKQKINFVEKNIKNISDKPMSKYSYPRIPKFDKNEINDTKDPYRTINNFDCEKGNYDEVDFGYYPKGQLQQLFDIDAKLEKLNKNYSEISTKKNIKGIKENCSNKNQESNNDPKSQKDYLAEQKKNREIRNKIIEIDKKIVENQRKEFTDEKIESFVKQFNEEYYSDPNNNREKELSFKIPEEFSINKMNEQLKECETNLEDIIKRVNEYEKEEREKFDKPKIITEEEKKYLDDIDNLKSRIEVENQESNKFMKILESNEKDIQNDIKIIENELDNADIVFRKNQNDFDKAFHDYEDEVFNKYYNMEDEEYEYIPEKSKEDYYRIYGIEDIMHREYDNIQPLQKIEFNNDDEFVEI